MGAIIPIALMVLGTGLSAYGQIQAGKAEAAAGEAEKAAADYSALSEEQAGRYEARLEKRRGRALRSTQRAKYGASGVSLMSPSALDVLEEQAISDEMDVQAILYNSKVRANRLRSSGQLALFRGKVKKRTAYFGAGSTLLTGAARTYSTGKELGVWGR